MPRAHKGDPTRPALKNAAREPRPASDSTTIAASAPRHAATARTDVMWPVALCLLSFAALLWSCRGAPLGTAVADDYFFLANLNFQRPLDLFDSMGVAYYWRPLSRQVYFSIVGNGLLAAPWAVAVLHGAMLLALFVVLYRIARRGFAVPIAAAIAAFPLMSEPARVLLTWPSGAQHLMVAVAAALALHETLRGRAWSAAVATLAGLLSNESGIFVLPALPIAAWYRTHQPRVTLRFAAVAAGAGAVWALGYAIALRHGVLLPPGSEQPFQWPLMPGLFAQAITALLNLEDLPAPAAAMLGAGHVVVVVAALATMLRRSTRERIAPRLPAITMAALWFVLGTALLVVVLPDWNGWRGWYPAIGIGVALTGLLAMCAPWLAATFVALRLVALLITPAAPVIVTPVPPVTASKMSFARLTRLQHAVNSTRHVLTSQFPQLPHSAAVRFWSFPRATQIGFQDSLAVRVWYRDSTLTWGTFGGLAGLTRPIDAMLEFIDNEHSPAVMIEGPAIRAFQQAGLAVRANELHAADSLLSVAEHERHAERGPFLAAIALNRAFVAFDLGDHARADSLNRRSLALNPKVANAWSLAADLALQRNDRDAAIEAVKRCLSIEPEHAGGLRVAEALGASVR